MFGWEQIIHNAAACLVPNQCPQATCTTALTSAAGGPCSYFVLAAHWQPLLPSPHPTLAVLSQVPSLSQSGTPADPVHPPPVHCGLCMGLPHPCWQNPASPRSSCKRDPCRSYSAPSAAKLSTQVSCQSIPPGSWLGIEEKGHCWSYGRRGAGRHAGWCVECASAAHLPVLGPDSSLCSQAQLQEAAFGRPLSACW